MDGYYIPYWIPPSIPLNFICAPRVVPFLFMTCNFVARRFFCPLPIRKIKGNIPRELFGDIDGGIALFNRNLFYRVTIDVKQSYFWKIFLLTSCEPFGKRKVVN